MGLDVADHKFYIDVGDLLMLVVHLEDEKNGCSSAELEGALQCGGHKCALSDESPQAVKRDALHVEGLLYGAEVNVPQVESVLVLKGVPWDGALVSQLQKYAVEVKCGHLKEQVGKLLQVEAMWYPWVNLHRRKMMYKLTLGAVDDNMWRTMCG